jgi:putative ABC transport system permease protein
MRGALRRIRAYAGHFGALAVLVALACALLTAAPRVGARITADGLRAQLVAGAPGTRDVTYDQHPSEGLGAAKAGESTLTELHESLPPAVRGAVGRQWYSASVDAAFARATGAGLRPDLRAVAVGLRTISGADKAVRLLSGRWPATTDDSDAVVEVAVAERAARQLGLSAGGRFAMKPLNPLAGKANVLITGVFQPIDETAELWQFQRSPTARTRCTRSPIRPGWPRSSRAAGRSRAAGPTGSIPPG